MGSGKRIEKFRKAKGLTQAQVAREIGVSEAAVRHYEHGIRTPKAPQITAIAKALEITPEAISDYGIEDERDIVEVLFRLEEIAGLKPVKTEQGTILVLDDIRQENERVRYACVSWESMREKLDSGSITQEEYDSWKASFHE